eukprot:4510890-Pyramimonas_sp.AAC.1
MSCHRRLSQGIVRERAWLDAHISIFTGAVSCDSPPNHTVAPMPHLCVPPSPAPARVVQGGDSP